MAGFDFPGWDPTLTMFPLPDMVHCCAVDPEVQEATDTGDPLDPGLGVDKQSPADKAVVRASCPSNGSSTEIVCEPAS